MVTVKRFEHHEAPGIGISLGYHNQLMLSAKHTGTRRCQILSSLIKNLKSADENACLEKMATPHTLLYSGFYPAYCNTTRLPQTITDLRFIQALPGYSNLKTTTNYTHLTIKGVDRIQSPLDNPDI